MHYPCCIRRKPGKSSNPLSIFPSSVEFQIPPSCESHASIMGIMNRWDESKETRTGRREEFATTNESKSEGWKIAVVTNDFSLDLVPSFPATLNARGAQHARFVSGRVFVSPRFLRLQGRRQKRDECEEKRGMIIFFFFLFSRSLSFSRCFHDVKHRVNSTRLCGQRVTG